MWTGLPAKGICPRVRYISGSFRDGAYQKTREASRYQRVIGVVALILAFAVIYLIAKYYPLLWQ